MMRMSLDEINTIVRGRQSGGNPEISTVSIDTRTLKPGDLYIAIKGENFDGNDYVQQAGEAKAAAVLLEKDINTALPKVLVGETRLALARLAGAVREKVGIPLVGITGSNGKTTVKEMLAAILSVNAKVLFTKGNLNNDIGVPLTLLRLHKKYQFAVIEMGANHPGEIRYTSHYAKPDVAVMNNVGAAHIEGFGNLKGVAKAKSELIESLDEQGIAVLNADDKFFEFWQSIAGNRKVVSFGLSDAADITASGISTEIFDGKFITKFSLQAKQKSISISMQLAGEHNVSNALAASAACIALDIDLKQIKQGLETMQPVAGRLQLMQGELGSTIINDSYNANPESLKAALDVLANCDGELWVVLGAFGELGSESKQLHEELGELMKSKKVDRLLAIGSDAEYCVKNFGKNGAFFSSQDVLIATLKSELSGNETILIKGSRSQHMENVVAALIAGKES